MPKKDKNKKFRSRSKVVISPQFELIMENYDKFGNKMSQKAFHRKYVEPLDPNIQYISWLRFANNISRTVKKRTDILINKFVEKRATENQMENESIKSILTISGATLDALIKDPEMLASIPVKERMQWLFNAMKARDNRMMALARVQGEKRKTSMFENMLEAAQYGEIKEGEFSKSNSAPEKVVPSAPAKIIESPPSPPTKIIEFESADKL